MNASGLWNMNEQNTHIYFEFKSFYMVYSYCNFYILAWTHTML